MKRLSFLVLALLCACSSEPQKPSASFCMPQQAEHRIDELMQYYGRLKNLPQPELASEHQKMSLEFSKSKSEMSRMKLALLLWLPGTPFRDPSASLQLLESGPKENGSGLENFSEIFAAMLKEKAASDVSTSQLEEELKAEKKLSSELLKKIDAIKKMEKNMIRMEKP